VKSPEELIKDLMMKENFKGLDHENVSISHMWFDPGDPGDPDPFQEVEESLVEAERSELSDEW